MGKKIQRHQPSLDRAGLLSIPQTKAKGRTIWILDAHGYGKRFIVRADEKLTAFLELQGEIHEFAVSLIT